MRQNIITNLKMYYTGMIAKHKTNVQVYITNSAGIGEHNDIVESIDKELDALASAEDKLNVLIKHFS